MNAFEQYEKLTEQNTDPTIVHENVNEKHYIWYAGEDLPHKEVVGGFIRRGEVTPILAMPVWDKTDDVPEELRVRLRSDGREAQYLIPPYPIFRTIMGTYEDKGVVDLTVIKDWDPKAAWKLQIDKVFFPNGIAETYDDIEAQIVDAKIPAEHADIYKAIAAEMLRGVKACRKADTALVDEAEGNIEKSKTHAGYSSTYTEPALRAMKRLNRERKDYAVQQVATRQNAIVDALPQMIQSMAQQQGTSLTPEHLMAFAKTLGEQITNGVKEAIASVKPATAPTQQSLPQNNQGKR